MNANLILQRNKLIKSLTFLLIIYLTNYIATTNSLFNFVNSATKQMLTIKHLPFYNFFVYNGGVTKGDTTILFKD